MMKIIEQIIEKLEGAKNILITSHIRPDGDSIGSQIATFFMLKSMEKVPTILNEDNVPIQYGFIKGVEEIKNINFFKDNEEFDICIILDCNSWDRIGRVKDVALRSKVCINIDHHLGNGIGDINFLDIEASSVSEQIYRIIKEWGIELTKEIAIPLYVALFTDTGGFTQKNVTSKTHMVAADLIEAGIHPEEVFFHLHKIEEVGALRLTGYALMNARFERGIAYSCISKNVVEEIKCSYFQTEWLLHQLSFLNGAKVVALFREEEKGVRVNLRSNYIDVARVAERFGGGGHEEAAGFLMSGELEEVKKKVLNELSKKIND